MNGKWTAAVTAVLFVLAVLAVTPVGNSAKGLFASNADKVDGIHASRTARAGMLLPLGKDGKFPASVVPTVTGPRGPAGPAGPQGAKGDTGASGAQGPKGDTGAPGLASVAAAPTSSSATIVACRNDTNGLLRVVADAASCRTHETALSWNVQGPPGEQGPPGPPGSGGGALAFAHVLADGTIDRARSTNNVLAVTRGLVPGSGTPTVPGSGFTLYCFDLSATAKNVSVTVEDSIVTLNPPPVPGNTVGMRSPFINATVDPSVAEDFGCAGATDAAVVITTGAAGVPFYVMFN